MGRRYGIALACAALAACADGPQGPGPDTVELRLDRHALSLGIDDTRQLVARRLDHGDSAPAPIQWRTGNAAIAVVSASGLVRATGPGRTWVEASDTRHTDTAWVDAYPRFASIVAGDGFSCALTGGGRALCWGRNTYGSLGDGRLVDRARPGLVAGVPPLSALSAGAGSVCGPGASGLWCWGYNGVGQLADGTIATHGTPVHSADTLTFSALTMGAGTTSCGMEATVTPGSVAPRHAGAHAGDTRALCWGWNGYGQLLGGIGPNARRPRRLASDHVFTILAPGGHHVCALDELGAAWCWGRNDSGQLGDGTSTSSTEPVAVTGGHVFRALVSGITHTCALADDGAWCWGDNSHGQLDGGASPGGPPVLAAAGSFQAITGSADHTCAVASGTAWCWGRNASGQLGRGSASPSGAAAAIPAIAFISLSAGGDHTCGVTIDGGAWCWGRNDYGQLGTDTLAAVSTPNRIGY